MHSIYLAVADKHLNTGGILTWIQDNLVVLLLAVIGVFILAGSHKGNFSKVGSTVVVAVIALIFIVGPTLVIGFSQGLSHTFLK